MSRNTLQSLITSAATGVLDIQGDEIAFELSLTADAKFGDYACNIAMVASKQLGKSPRELAEQLKPAFEAIDGVSKVDVAGPGFINLTMNDKYWAGLLAKDAESSKVRLGKVQVEFISANPTGPMTLANARGGFTGDALANVLSESGWDVEREYYVNDAGGQVSKLADSVRAEKGLDIEGERQYQGEYIKELAEKVDPTRIEEEDDFERELVKTVIADYLKPAVARLGIEFDTWFSEASLTQTGESERVLNILKAAKLVDERDGAIWLRSTELGDERDRVLVRSSGEPTYLLGDLAYHANIFLKRGFDRAIKLWGADHAGQVQSLKLGLSKIAPEARIDFLLLQFVRLIQDGVEVKMSKRAGTYVTIDELLDMLEAGVGSEHAVNVARWFFLSRSGDNRIDFDLNIAREESQKNPYFYVMYSYARAQSLLGKAATADLEPQKPESLTAPVELNLVKLISSLDEAVDSVAEDFGVQRLPHLAYEMAKSFTTLYEIERILDLPVQEASTRLYVVQRYVEALERIFGLMGVHPIKRMDKAE